MSSRNAILIVHFRDNQETLKCLDSLRQVKDDFHTYILSVQSHQELASHTLNPTIIKTDKNGGFAFANNLLMKKALTDGYESLVLLNNDTIVDERFLAPLLKYKDIGLVSPKIYFSKGREFHHDDYQETERGKVVWYAGGVVDWANVRCFHWGVNEVDHGQFEQPTETDFATGCCVAVSNKIIDQIGLLDEKYFMYWEDVDWSQRAKKRGLKVLMEPASVIWHANAGSVGGAGSAKNVAWQNRSRRRFGLKWAPIKTKFHLLINH